MTSDSNLDVDALLRQSNSPDLRTRLSSIRPMAVFAATSQQVFDRLVAALDDEDTAVGQAAAIALIDAAGDRGLAAVCEGVQTLDDQVGYWLLAALRRFWWMGSPTIAATERLATHGQSASVREGAEGALSYLTPYPVDLHQDRWRGL